MGLLWFLLGAIVGGGLVFFVLTRQSDLRVAEAEMRVARDLNQAQANANDADIAHRETKERLIALQLEHDTLRARQSTTEMTGGEPVGADAPSGMELDQALEPAPSPAKMATDPNDLKRIKGIGPALERRLNELGVKDLADLAGLEPAEVDRINAKLDFPGRIQRERWIEQAKDLLGA